jgi:hypothetical protein
MPRGITRALYRQWMNADRTISVRVWDDGLVVITTRNSPDDVWGPPLHLTEVERHEV